MSKDPFEIISRKDRWESDATYTETDARAARRVVIVCRWLFFVLSAVALWVLIPLVPVAAWPLIGQIGIVVAVGVGGFCFLGLIVGGVSLYNEKKKIYKDAKRHGVLEDD